MEASAQQIGQQRTLELSNLMQVCGSLSQLMKVPKHESGFKVVRQPPCRYSIRGALLDACPAEQV